VIELQLNPPEALDCIAINGDDQAMRYAGGKGRLWQELVSLMPPHVTYIETHLGGGAVIRHKAAAERNIGIDVDPRVIAFASDWDLPNLTLHQCDAVEFLRSYKFDGSELIYADPPYVASTKSNRRYYRYEYTDDDHAQLLTLIRTLSCRVLISGYACDLYNTMLSDWNKKVLVNVTRGGCRKETVWANFEFSVELQDYSWIGSSYRERERIKRKTLRWTSRSEALPVIERHALLSALQKRREQGVNEGAKMHLRSPHPEQSR
jgi:DNA adenine methylase